MFVHAVSHPPAISYCLLLCGFCNGNIRWLIMWLLWCKKWPKITSSKLFFLKLAFCWANLFSKCKIVQLNSQKKHKFWVVLHIYFILFPFLSFQDEKNWIILALIDFIQQFVLPCHSCLISIYETISWFGLKTILQSSPTMLSLSLWLGHWCYAIFCDAFTV